MINRDKLLAKVRALMAKTMENGCSEHEAMAALAKARGMIDAYEISDEELKLTKEEKAVFADSTSKLDKHGIRNGMAMAIARFTGCEVWRNSNGGLTFCGLRSDADFAHWLVDSLAQFGQSELAAYLGSGQAQVGNRRLLINGFVAGFASRVSARINAMADESQVASRAKTNGTALVVVKENAVKEALASKGIKLRKGRRSSRRMDYGAHSAGSAAGGRASFGRPVGGNSSGLLA
jgi:hypothetical protein